MGTVRYTVIDGEVIAQERDGVRHQFVPDALGSTVALYDSAGTKTDTFGYWPYGESSERTGSTNLQFRYIGVKGYYTTNQNRIYIRLRNYNSLTSSWLERDRLNDVIIKYKYFVNSNRNVNSYYSRFSNVYSYCGNSPVSLSDPSGLSPAIGIAIGIIGLVIVGICADRASNEIGFEAHKFNDKYAHCLANATFTRCMRNHFKDVFCVSGAFGAGAASAWEHPPLSWLNPEDDDPFDVDANWAGFTCGCSLGNVKDCCRDKLCRLEKEGLTCSGVSNKCIYRPVEIPMEMQ
jgi:RHS repeat-associated protein